ncbi:MAG: lipopolysaccharide heptosyltransferase II [Halothiobacillaceae bacterium]|nr:MAG: lipopolysaccharide heptosyltransferase II [Halothiobacillaceae bacterium]
MNPRSILIVGPSWVGDMVMAHSLFQTLRLQHPDCVIDVLAPGWSLPLLARMPEVRHGIAMPLGHGELGLGARWRIGRSLRGQYDQAIILPGSIKSALAPFFAGIPQRTAYRGEHRYGLVNDMRPLDKALLPLTVQRFVALGLPAGSPQLPEYPTPRLRVDASKQQRLIAELGLSLDRPAVAFMPGAEYGPAKQWPLEHFAALARALVAQGKRVWILGSSKDEAAGATIAEQAGEGVLNLCGRTRLEDAIDLLALCEAAVTNDSGLMHVAAALDIPTVALFGSSSPSHTPPLSDKAQVIYLGLDCSPCFKRTCPLGHTRCLADITPERVLNTPGIMRN